MVKKGKLITTDPSVYSPPPYTSEQQENDFKRGYEFNKPVPVRSPVGGWEYNYIRSGEPTSRVPKKESALVKGVPHSFRGIRTGNSYSSRQSIRRTTKGKK